MGRPELPRLRSHEALPHISDRLRALHGVLPPRLCCLCGRSCGASRERGPNVRALGLARAGGVLPRNAAVQAGGHFQMERARNASLGQVPGDKVFACIETFSKANGDILAFSWSIVPSLPCQFELEASSISIYWLRFWYLFVCAVFAAALRFWFGSQAGALP